MVIGISLIWADFIDYLIAIDCERLDILYNERAQGIAEEILFAFYVTLKRQGW